jgi:hypothetical protein
VPRFTRTTSVVALLASIVFLACTGRGEKPRADSAAPAPPGAGVQPGAPAGALTKPIDDYSGDEFYQFTRRLAFSGGRDRDRVCAGLQGCDGPNPSSRTLVRIDAVTAQDSLLPSNTPSNGVVAVRIVNRGALEEARYRLKPDTTIEYYMIVTAQGGQWRWRLEELTTTAGARRHASVGTGTLLGCNHPWTRGARADFKTCAEAADTGAAAQRTIALRFALAGPVWMACGMGCCEFQ